MNIVSEHSLSSPLEVSVLFSSYSTSDPFIFLGFAGRLARFHAAKHTLDMQVGHIVSVSICVCSNSGLLQWTTDTVYQEDYFSLLNVTEIGQRITYSPSSFSLLLPTLANSVNMAIDQVYWVLTCCRLMCTCTHACTHTGEGT